MVQFLFCSESATDRLQWFLFCNGLRQSGMAFRSRTVHAVSMHSVYAFGALRLLLRRPYRAADAVSEAPVSGSFPDVAAFAAVVGKASFSGRFPVVAAFAALFGKALIRNLLNLAEQIPRCPSESASSAGVPIEVQA